MVRLMFGLSGNLTRRMVLVGVLGGGNQAQIPDYVSVLTLAVSTAAKDFGIVLATLTTLSIST